MQYTQAQIDRANAVSLEDFLRTQGETLIKSGREYRWKEHDSLTVRGNKWFRHSQSKGGYPIDFVMEFYGKSFPEAVQLLTGESGEGQSEASTAPPTAFHLPLHNRTADRAIQYLTESRGLNKTLVEAFLLSGDIYEDAKRHNVVFVGRDRSGTPRYAHVRGTADPFRQDIAGSDKSYPFRHEGMSIENQHLALNEFVSSMPESTHAEVLEFIDNGYSGTNFERPKVQELIEMVRANKIDCIIVKDFSRFGRNSIETGYFIERVFPLFHTRFISINDDFDSDQHKGDTGGMDVAFKYLISEYYSRDMSIKTKSAKYAKMQRGEYQSKVCPYGYRKSANGRMEPNPETAAVVQLIFQLAATGIGAAAVTRELFKRGIPTPGEYKAAHGQQYHDVSRSRGRWSSSTVLRILEDERYIGSYVIGRRAVIEVGSTRSRKKDRDKWFIIPDHHPAIVDKELFEKVQAVQRRFSLPTKKTREYPLKGKVYCGCCDHALSRIAQKRPFYMCRHSTADVNSRCRDVRADVAGLEEAVLLTLKKQLEILLPVHKDGTIHLEATAAKCSEYEKQLEALKDQKQALFERYLLGQIELDTYKSEKAVYDAEILKVKNAYAAVTAQAKLKREEQARQSSRQEIVHSIAEADVLTSELTDLLIEKVYVFPDNRIEIIYKVHDLFE